MSVFISKKDLFEIILPAILAIFLFVSTVFGYLLPTFRNVLINQQKYMLRQMVNTAWNMLEVVQKEELSGKITREKAQEIVIEHLRGMRYGEDNLDYFWINDLNSHMIMHPYREDLENKELFGNLDTKVKSLFAEFIRLVKKDGEGFVTYDWQWKNDPSRIEPKLSFVKAFPPWNWVIGTGIYLRDVNEQIDKLVRRMMVISGMIIVLVSSLTLYMTIKLIKTSAKRLETEGELKKYQNHLEQLVQDRTAELSKEISEKTKLEEALKRITITDELTGLYNRRGFMKLAEKQIQIANRHNNVLFMLYMDLDNMKSINDNFGHEMGDKALIETAQILKSVLRESDIVSRLGGDEFVALTQGSSSEEKGQTITNRLHEQLRIANFQAERPYELLMSIGFSMYNPEVPCSIDELLAQADSMMYEQKMKATDASRDQE
ncbi:MAG: diguanylate cyclase [Proteobacteria bacterium]|nr:diguanylate cyclase [Desulfobulbaceae bacterium]MBU4152987.1 diguanylate cyclase [Pseudomonadota bacterium]